jgi:hypothetical protein
MRNLSAPDKAGWQHAGMTPDGMREDAREVKQPAAPRPDLAERIEPTPAQPAAEAAQERQAEPPRRARVRGLWLQ